MFRIQNFLAAVVALSCLSETNAGVLEGCPKVKFTSRSEWNAEDAIAYDDMSTPVDHFVVHHSAGSSCDDAESCSRVVKSIQDYHMKTNGWWDIGYSYLIGGDGVVYEGRGWDRVGAHSGSTEYNSNGIGVCMIGDFETSLPTQVALHALEDFIDCCVSSEKLKSTYNVVGHRDVRATECPGTKFYTDYVQKMTKYGV